MQTPSRQPDKRTYTNSLWMHAICLFCFAQMFPKITPLRDRSSNEIRRCCFCREQLTEAGITIPYNPADLTCGGKHTKGHSYPERGK